MPNNSYKMKINFTDGSDPVEAQLPAFYTIPNDGIPKNDLDSNVQASLNKADTAL